MSISNGIVSSKFYEKRGFNFEILISLFLVGTFLILWYLYIIIYSITYIICESVIMLVTSTNINRNKCLTAKLLITVDIINFIKHFRNSMVDC